MNRIQLLVIATFVLAFVAGGSVGMLITSGSGQETTRRSGPGGHLAGELHLTPEQQAQMHKIWSKVMGEQGSQQVRKRRLELNRQRTEAIEALLTDEQRVRYEQILADYARQVEQIDQERRRLTQQAVERTKEILTEEQAKKYEQMRQGRGHPRGSGKHQPGALGPGRRGGPRSRPRPGGPPDRAPGPSDRPAQSPEEHRGQETSEEPANPTEP